MSSLLAYPPAIEAGIAKIEALLDRDATQALLRKLDRGSTPSLDGRSISRRSIALLLLQKDPFVWSQLEREPYFPQIAAAVAATQAQSPDPLTFAIAQTRQKLALEIERETTIAIGSKRHQQSLINEWLHWLTVNPITGVPILVVILYYGIYQFVGVFGAGTLVDAIETFFEEQINPAVNSAVAQIFPWEPLQDLIANDYGIITLGIRYAVAIVLPVVTTFFFMFSLLEDSGYLPRLSLLVDRLFKTIGLSGRSIIPLILGLGCGTMATLVTRTLESKRERIIATLLLALTIPCSAQLGVILGLLSQNPTALMIWAGFMGAIFLSIGFLTAKVLPGKSACFYLEIPPLRLPRLKAIVTKTYVRLKWYFAEILPLFIFASVLIWIGKLTGLFDLLVKGLEPLMLWLGLPPAAAPVFLYGFFRRDYGAAGMFDLSQQGILVGQQLVVAAITLTLFIPCIAQFQFMLKERGLKITLAITTFVFCFAFVTGHFVDRILSFLEVSF